jgi:ABC-type multidrug transport system ATPase subunit
VSREVDDGRGPADFKISRGAWDKTILEFKLAKNSHLKRNLQQQAQLYQDASDAEGGLRVVMYFTDQELKRVQKILQELSLTGHPDIMLIDEVLAVGDAAFSQKCLDVFYERRRAGKTVVLVTHDMAMVQSLCHRGMVLHDGELEFLGDPEDTALRYLRLNSVATASRTSIPDE